jgi:hypothetical protein
MSDKAMLIETEEIFDIVDMYLTMEIEISFENNKVQFPNQATALENKVRNYKLSNGNVYREDSVIIGEDVIRDYKLNKLIEVKKV